MTMRVGTLNGAEPLTHVVLQFCDGEVRARAGQDCGGDLLAQTIVGHAEHRGFVHVGMLVQRGLDFRAVDVLACAQTPCPWLGPRRTRTLRRRCDRCRRCGANRRR